MCNSFRGHQSCLRENSLHCAQQEIVTAGVQIHVLPSSLKPPQRGKLQIVLLRQSINGWIQVFKRALMALFFGKAEYKSGLCTP